MPRLTPIDPAKAQGRAKELFEGPLKGKAFNIFTSMANSPAALDAYVAMGAALVLAALWLERGRPLAAQQRRQGQRRAHANRQANHGELRAFAHRGAQNRMRRRA